jgi:hypothetical protein
MKITRTTDITICGDIPQEYRNQAIAEADKHVSELIQQGICLGDFTIQVNGSAHHCRFDTNLLDFDHQLPINVINSLNMYVNDKIQLLGFLEAILSNDLVAAVSSANPGKLSLIPNIVEYCNEYLPPLSWGSKENVQNWYNR